MSPVLAIGISREWGDGQPERPGWSHRLPKKLGHSSVWVQLEIC